MSLPTEPFAWLDEIKEDARKLTLRRLEDDGFDTHKAKEDELNGVVEAPAETKTKK